MTVDKSLRIFVYIFASDFIEKTMCQELKNKLKKSIDYGGKVVFCHSTHITWVHTGWPIIGLVPWDWNFIKKNSGYSAVKLLVCIVKERWVSLIILYTIVLCILWSLHTFGFCQLRSMHTMRLRFSWQVETSVLAATRTIYICYDLWSKLIIR